MQDQDQSLPPLTLNPTTAALVDTYLAVLTKHHGTQPRRAAYVCAYIASEQSHSADALAAPTMAAAQLTPIAFWRRVERIDAQLAAAAAAITTTQCPPPAPNIQSSPAQGAQSTPDARSKTRLEAEFTYTALPRSPTRCTACASAGLACVASRPTTARVRARGTSYKCQVCYALRGECVRGDVSVDSNVGPASRVSEELVVKHESPESPIEAHAPPAPRAQAASNQPDAGHARAQPAPESPAAATQRALLHARNGAGEKRPRADDEEDEGEGAAAKKRRVSDGQAAAQAGSAEAVGGSVPRDCAASGAGAGAPSVQPVHAQPVQPVQPDQPAQPVHQPAQPTQSPAPAVAVVPAPSKTPASNAPVPAPAPAPAPSPAPSAPVPAPSADERRLQKVRAAALAVVAAIDGAGVAGSGAAGARLVLRVQDMARVVREFGCGE
ncbi:hypothetical protein PsYK624_039950 [Phanerochaete sordida]|uniref:Uncharacterized protein n=1 Tax=Phanerochaete sordida TaxID=48140 RepID=A0A9P3LBK0_9APHY|nr:hypothetical protein PsYK624_039950 [Phanerochaete sordida]